MFRRKQLLFVASVIAVLLFGSIADAGPLGIFGRNRSNTTVRYTANDSACVCGPDGNCLTHPIRQATVVAASVPTAPMQQAMADVVQAEAALEAARAEVARVRVAQRRAVARQRLELQNQIDDLLAQQQALGPLATE